MHEILIPYYSRRGPVFGLDERIAQAVKKPGQP
jgi:hypothetical protein